MPRVRTSYVRISIASIFSFVTVVFGACGDANTDSLLLAATKAPRILVNVICDKATTLTVKGVVDLVHRDQAKDRQSPVAILIACENIVFIPGASIRTQASVDLRARTSLSGSVTIENTRGVRGIDAVAAPGPYSRGSAKHGESGRNGANGRNAGRDATEDWGSERGADGGRGSDGEDGKTGTMGLSGKDGKNGATILVRAGTYLPGTVLTLLSEGGDGGNGAPGGSGAAGGNGGKGGNGGAGGDGNDLHSAGRGGNGGAGGNGGKGGDGGPGGDGGAGGNGGTIGVYLTTRDGSPPTELMIKNRGGAGGAPGRGGDPGSGGRGGEGGVAGCGGAGSNWVGPQWKTQSGCGEAGARGDEGPSGAAGPYGSSGRNGSRGELLRGHVSAISKKKTDMLAVGERDQYIDL